ncbi:disulfide bond formation protein DsbB [Candidatus Enterovibrio escicola]|uniref:disulfide bond formation protein DsbB n=1 Tax=Candidatus Enterovibrio escicola TaxID=1927127 RepID=UPI0012380F9C|nr:disulfide bond formation protein DsbB [Candidatus Enterovibrio escacola]
MLSFLNKKKTSRIRGAWFLLTLSAVGFEICALYFQYVMSLAPCVLCIYERVAMLGNVSFGLVGFLALGNEPLRWLSLIGWGVSSGWGLKLAIEHVSYQFHDSNDLFGVTCDIFVYFPSWAPFNKWIPWMLEASGECSKVVWKFLNLSMPEWLVIIFSVMLLALAIVVLSQFFGKHERKLF